MIVVIVAVVVNDNLFSFHSYASQLVLVPSISYVLLYVTALSPGVLVSSFLIFRGVSTSSIGIFRGFSAVWNSSFICSPHVTFLSLSRLAPYLFLCFFLLIIFVSSHVGFKHLISSSLPPPRKNQEGKNEGMVSFVGFS